MSAEFYDLYLFIVAPAFNMRNLASHLTAIVCAYSLAMLNF